MRRDDIERAIANAIKPFGVNLSFSELKDGRLSIEITEETASNPAFRLFQERCSSHGLKPEYFGKIIKINGRLNRVVGIRNRTDRDVEIEDLQTKHIHAVSGRIIKMNFD